jgi:hypothetical protein
MDSWFSRLATWCAAVRASVWPQVDAARPDEDEAKSAFAKRLARTAPLPKKEEPPPDLEPRVRAAFAREAQALLSAPAFAEAHDRLLRTYMQAWLNTPGGAVAERERLYAYAQAARAVQSELVAMMAAAPAQTDEQRPGRLASSR